MAKKIEEEEKLSFEESLEKLEDIVSLLTNVTNENFQHDYLKAVDIYNRMTDEEAPCN